LKEYWTAQTTQTQTVEQ